MSSESCTDRLVGRAVARVGLLGNPSDGYGGRVLAMTLPEFEATVVLQPAAEWDFAESELLEATINAARQRHPDLVAEPGRLSFTTAIPRQVGLAGSSAIIMAALRALATRSSIEWDLVQLAKTTLEVETQVLGWVAGPQDRVVQAYEGLLDMEFAEAWRGDRYERLDPDLLPPLFLAWDQSTGKPSDVAHSKVRDRWLAGDTQVVDVMSRFAELAVEGRTALDTGSAAEDWPRLMDEAFRLRSAIWNITPTDTALIETGKSIGAGVAFAGSGGAVAGSVSDPGRLVAAAEAYGEMGAGFAVINP